MAWDNLPAKRDAVKSFIVVNALTDQVNIEASVSKFRDALTKHLGTREGNDDLIRECLTNLFDYHKGVRMTMDFIASQTVDLMGKKNADLKNPQLFSRLGKRVREVVALDVKAGVYASERGPSGGHYRVCDAPPPKVETPVAPKAD
jgi:hypothetical protein